MSEPDPARTRFAILSLLRLVAGLLVLAGIVIANGRIAAIPVDLAQPLGIALAVVGFADLLLVVPLLARRWRSEP